VHGLQAAGVRVPWSFSYAHAEGLAEEWLEYGIRPGDFGRLVAERDARDHPTGPLIAEEFPHD